MVNTHLLVKQRHMITDHTHYIFFIQMHYIFIPMMLIDRYIAHYIFFLMLYSPLYLSGAREMKFITLFISTKRKKSPPLEYTFGMFQILKQIRILIDYLKTHGEINVCFKYESHPNH